MALSKAKKKNLVAYIGKLCNWNCAFTKVHIKLIAESLIEACGDFFKFNINKIWVDWFLGKIFELMITWSLIQFNLKFTAS